MFLGIEIGGTKLQLVLGTEHGAILKRHRAAVDKARGGAGIRDEIKSGFEALVGSAKLSGVGVGFGGPVDWRTGKICCSHQIEGWHNFELGRWLAELTHAPVKIDNDANVACLGEAVLGAGKGASPVFYVTLGSGVGGGLALDERIYHGGIPGESEIGHVRLDRTGSIVEQRCSGWAVDRKIREAVKTEPNSALARLCANDARGEARHLGEALRAGDSLAQRIVDDVAEDLAFALSHVLHLAHPNVIVIGGGLSLVGEPLRAAIENALPRFVMEAFHPVPRVKIAALGEDAVPCGALLLAGQAK